MKQLTKSILREKLSSLIKGHTTFETLSDWAITIESEDRQYGRTDAEQRLIADILFDLIEADIPELRPSEEKLKYYLRCLEDRDTYSADRAAATGTIISPAS